MRITTGLIAIRSLLGATAAGAATLGANARAFALGDEGATLVTVASGAASAVGLTVEDGARVTLDGIDYRPETGEIYGYDDTTDAVYLIDTVTGAATRVAQSRGITNDNGFNPLN